ncbi:MAG: phosphoenolpyruvate--protein phosphotransferase [Planctomycetaceae bacterium]|nr:phosphoenolpyruvate--protein phosphotransferase [Planctomycetaceae bacterium]
MRRGIAVSPGIAVGIAYVITEIYVGGKSAKITSEEVKTELDRFEAARHRTAMDLQHLERKVATQVGPEEAAIFAVHRSILRDPGFSNHICKLITDEQISAQAALRDTVEYYESLFARSRDEYLQERVNDIRDIAVRLSAYLSNVKQDVKKDQLHGKLIVFADELLPSQVVALGDIDVAGIVTQKGSQTSHAAIIARSRGIPAVSGINGILRQVTTGDEVVVDGRDGSVIINPNDETLRAFRKVEREFVDLKDQLAENRDLPAKTLDGVNLHLQGNVNNVADVRAAAAMGATGVGLYRTEYLYLTHPDVPDEQEQFENYSQIIAAAPDQNVTIRTLDIGGDKTVAYLGHNHQEANPFMGWRSIRLSFEHRDFFMTQIRAILRAAAQFPDGQVRMLFPMVTTLEEMRRLRKMVGLASKQLQQAGVTPKRVPVGMMIEVPAAAICIDMLLEAVDFVSIGSNDLVQYLMAADRDNPKVSHLCQPLAPAVLRVLKSVIHSCNRVGKPVTLCGEMAGQHRAFILLLGMGLTRFSMSPAFLPSIKQLAAQVSVVQAKQILAEALEQKTTNQVRQLLTDQLESIAPNLRLMESQ